MNLNFATQKPESSRLSRLENDSVAYSKRLRDWESELEDRERAIAQAEFEIANKQRIIEKSLYPGLLSRSLSVTANKLPSTVDILVSGVKFSTSIRIISAAKDSIFPILLREADAQRMSCNDDASPPFTLIIEGRSPSLFSYVLEYLRLKVLDEGESVISSLEDSFGNVNQLITKDPTVKSFKELVLYRQFLFTKGDDPLSVLVELEDLAAEAEYYGMNQMKDDVKCYIDRNRPPKTSAPSTVPFKLSTSDSERNMVLCMTVASIEPESGEAEHNPLPTFLFVGTSDCKVSIFDISVAENTSPLCCFTAHVNMVTSLAVNHIPQHWLPTLEGSERVSVLPILVTASRDGRVCFWNLSSLPKIALENRTMEKDDTSLWPSWFRNPLMSSPEPKLRQSNRTRINDGFESTWRPPLIKRMKAHSDFIQSLVLLRSSENDILPGASLISKQSLFATGASDNWVKVWSTRAVLEKENEKDLNAHLINPFSDSHEAIHLSEDFETVGLGSPVSRLNSSAPVASSREEATLIVNLPSQQVYGIESERSQSMPPLTVTAQPLANVNTNTTTNTNSSKSKRTSQPIYYAHKFSSAVRALAFSAPCFLCVGFGSDISILDLHRRCLSVNIPFSNSPPQPIRCLGVGQINGTYAPTLTTRGGKTTILVGGYWDGTVKVWDISGSTEINPSVLCEQTVNNSDEEQEKTNCWISSVDIDNSGGIMISQGTSVSCFELKARKHQSPNSTKLKLSSAKVISTSHTDTVRCVTRLNDRCCVTGAFDGTIHIHNNTL